ncbi:MAG: PEP-CTERM sorting domain-containing protein [Phycisphaerales bacterium]
MYNDTLITKMGDVLDDGMIVASVRGGFSLSDDGAWAITPLRVFDPDSEQLRIGVYRFAIPAPSTAMLLAALGLTGVRRRR